MLAAQMATAIGLGMLLIVTNKTYEFLGEASVWIVISVGVHPSAPQCDENSCSNLQK